jgi:hypothetical protein
VSGELVWLDRQVAALAQFQRRLDGLAERHPELVGGAGYSEQAAAVWREVVMGAKLKGASPGVVVSFRLDAELLARVDAEVERMRAHAPWANVGRTDAVRKLLCEALERSEKAAKARR